MKCFFRAMLGSVLILPLFINSTTAQLEHFGLTGERINALAIVPPNSWPPPPWLAAGTDSHGVFLRDLSAPDSQWVYFGLNGKNIKSLYIQHWGMGPMEANRLFAGVRPNQALGDSTFLYTNPFLSDTTWWAPADTGLNPNEIQGVNGIAAVHYFAHTYLGPVFISTGGKMYRSYLPGLFPWQEISPQPGPAVINVVQIHQPIIWWLEATLWIGGETNIFWPYLAKSNDYGENWEFYYPNLAGDNACNSIAIAFSHPDTVYAGMEGAVIKTTDGRQNWVVTALQNTPYYFFGLVANPLDANQVVAGGTSNTGQSALYETFDGGANWEELQLPPAAAGVSCMIAGAVGNSFVVYIGTFGNGVYRYLTSPVGTGHSAVSQTGLNFILEQNYPNPFNLETAISYRLLAPSEVELMVYDLLGQRVCRLVRARQPVGRYQVKWNGRDDAGREVASGVYLCRLRVSLFVQNRKMLLLR